MNRWMLTGVVSLLATSLSLPALADFSNRTIRLSNGIAADHPVADGVRAMTECLAEKSDGAMRINAFWSSALGDDLQATQALRSGIQEAVVASPSPLVGMVPSLGVFDLPFLFADEAEADAVVDGEFGDFINQELEQVGLINLAYWENGFRNVSSSQRPITRWEDFSGTRIRVMQNNIFLDTFQNLGANPTPMAFGEIFSALETGAIDAQENPFVTIDTSKFYEVQDYVSETRHAFTPFLVMFSKRIWDTYSEDEQQALRDCAVVGRDVQRRVIREASLRSKEEIEAAGVAVNEISPEEQQRMREKSQVIYDRHRDQIGPEVIDRVQAILAELRSD
ncbi:TRAP transporter substrate-binding protein [Halotalea alkalilenta]|uniref:ABC transporter substrate-binding protein n=1 Tax=Halotalea alkalilenta TaxID=376489 RepID=A0A172YJM8_9GAMM|nr:TRAP transporter substrate-binding protein [Halotalea alkalilenta]ANF59423.1 ABC transporter substrate-binding protein [Halotalea alkalilenta]